MNMIIVERHPDRIHCRARVPKLKWKGPWRAVPAVLCVVEAKNEFDERTGKLTARFRIVYS